MNPSSPRQKQLPQNSKPDEMLTDQVCELGLMSNEPIKVGKNITCRVPVCLMLKDVKSILNISYLGKYACQIPHFSWENV